MVLVVNALLERLPSPTHAGDLGPAAVASAVALAAVVAVLVRRSAVLSPCAELPAPDSTLPVLGNTLDTMKKQRHRLYDWITDESLRHHGRPWQISIVGRPRGIVATSPEIFEDVLKTQLDVFGKGELSCSLIRDCFGRGILAVEGDEWFFQRKSASHLFSLQMMKDVMHEVIREKIAIFHEVLRTHSAGGPNQLPLSFRQVITHFTSDVFAKIGFGVELNCLERSLHGDNENAFVAAFTYCAQILQRRLQQPDWLWRLKRFLDLGDEKEYKAHMTVIDELIYDIIAKSVERKNGQRVDDGEEVPAMASASGKDLISLFLESKVTAPSHFARPELEQIRDMVVNFIFAGKDTTANSMAWFIVMMNRYPRVAAKIREELREKLPALGRGQLRVPSMEELKHLTYLEAAIRENLRLNPPVAMTARTAVAPTRLSDGTEIRAGERVILASYAAARQPTVWGPDAAEFRPERWIDETTGNLVTVSPFKFSSFLAGPRICIGRKFAMLEMKIALAVILSRFDLEIVGDPWAVTYELALTCPVAGPLLVNVTAL